MCILGTWIAAQKDRRDPKVLADPYGLTHGEHGVGRPNVEVANN